MSDLFFAAIEAGDLAEVHSAIAIDPSLLKAKDQRGLGPYTVARYARQPEVAELLLEKGVDLDIFAAVMAGKRLRVVELLASGRGLVNSYSHDGWTPLHLASFFAQPTIAETLIESGADVHARSRNPMANTPLHAAAGGRSVDAVRVLLQNGADPNSRQHGGWTPLHAAAQNGDALTAELLIALGADVKAQADNRQSPLDMAILKGHQQLVSLLEEHGAE